MAASAARRVSRTKKSSKNRKKAAQCVAKLHKKHADKRTAFQWDVAYQIINRQVDAVAVENLNIKGMKARCKPKPDDVKVGRFLKNGQSAKRGLNRSISDASWGTLINKIEYAAEKQGKTVFKVDPKNTSCTCSKCGVVDGLSRFGERFVCTFCSYSTHADQQAANLLKRRAIEDNGLTILVVRKPRKVRQDLSEPKQLMLFQTPNPESTGLKRRQHRARKGKRDVPGLQFDPKKMGQPSAQLVSDAADKSIIKGCPIFSRLRRGTRLLQLCLEWDNVGCGYPHESHHL